MGERTNEVIREVYLVSDTEYELNITLHAEGRLMDYVLKKGKRAFRQRTGTDVSSVNTENIKEFDVQDTYFGAIKTFLSKKVNHEGSILQICSNEMRRNGKIALDAHVTSAKFIKKDNDWDIKVVLNGLYTNTS